jgi:Ser-tRNA(Ala) deacylase AlaX
MPCGGTPVADLSEIGRMTIRKIKQEGRNIRIGYDVARY